MRARRSREEREDLRTRMKMSAGVSMKMSVKMRLSIRKMVLERGWRYVSILGWGDWDTWW